MTALATDLTQTDAEVLTMNEQYLIFVICEDLFGIPICDVQDIIPISQITPVPQQPHYLKGIINNRGTILPVLDVRLRFNREPMEYNDRTCIIVISKNNMSIGLIVDTVREVSTIPEAQIVAPPVSTSNRYVTGIGKLGEDVRLLVDCNALLDDILVMDENDA